MYDSLEAVLCWERIQLILLFSSDLRNNFFKIQIKILDTTTDKEDLCQQSLYLVDQPLFTSIILLKAQLHMNKIPFV